MPEVNYNPLAAKIPIVRRHGTRSERELGRSAVDVRRGGVQLLAHYLKLHSDSWLKSGKTNF